VVSFNYLLYIVHHKDPMISHPFQHPSKILGFCARVVEGTLRSHKLFMYLFPFLYWSNDKSSFKHLSKTLGFCAKMIE
jgi:hypothetical protein